MGGWGLGNSRLLVGGALLGRNFHAIIPVVAVFTLVGGALGRHLEAAALAKLGAEVADLRALEPRAPARLETALTEGAEDALRIRNLECEQSHRNSRTTDTDIERSLAITVEYKWTHTNDSIL